MKGLDRCGIRARPPALAHFEYINALPPASSLITPLHFNYIERLLLGGTNLMPAQRVRGREWGVEWGYIKRALKTDDLTWSACHPLVDLPLPWLTGVEDREMYLTAATHLSSRAFPSKLLSSPVPLPGGGILTEGDESHPILLPGIDLFNRMSPRETRCVCDFHTEIDFF